MLENTRKYDIERVLWKAKPADLPKLAAKLAKLANEFADKVATVYVSRGLLGRQPRRVAAWSCPPPWTAWRWAATWPSEFDGPMQHASNAQLVVFSGLKIDKLDDLEAMIGRGKIRMVFAAGSLAMALKKAAAELDGKQFCLGVAEDPAHSDKPYFIPPERIEQAKRMIADGREKGIEFVLPVDFVLQDGQRGGRARAGRPAVRHRPEDQRVCSKRRSASFIAAAQERASAVAFHNGVFGMFEDPQFEEGTRKFIAQLKRMKDAGVEVYVGGGEGGTALEKYGQARLGHARLHRRRHRAQRPGQRAGALSGGAAHGGREDAGNLIVAGIS